MHSHTICRAALVAAALFFLATTAYAQDPSDTFEGLQSVIQAGDHISVTGGSGGLFDGTLLDLSTTTLTLKVDGIPRVFSIDDVRFITRPQHLNVRSGAWWGLGIGAGLGLVGLPATECRIGAGCAGAAVALTGLFGGLGAAIGAASAATTVTDQLIFARRGYGAKLSFAPLVDRARRGVQMSVKF